MKLIGKFEVHLDEHAVEEMRSIGMKDTAIIHEACIEVQGGQPFKLTNLSLVHFSDCEIVEDKEPEPLPF